MATNTTVRFDMEGKEELLKTLVALNDLVIGKTLVDATMEGAKIIETTAKGYAPGPHIIRQLLSQKAGLVEVAIGPDKDHWYYVFHETGVTDHEIPSGKKKGEVILHFEGPDGEVFAYNVDHPGMAAEPFMRPAIDKSGTQAVRRVGEYLLQMMGKLYKHEAK